MRTLRFIVDDQIIRQDPNCDFSNLVPGTEGYVQAEFTFSPEWVDTVKVVGFYSMMGHEYSPQVLKDGKTCMIPSEALKRRSFKIRVIGKRGEFKILTNKMVINQTGGTE